MASILPKRTPSVLVTDAREPNRQSRPSIGQRQGTGVISVDSILQYGGDIPSAQRRFTPTSRPTHHARTPSGRHPLDPKLSGRLIPQHIPSRTSKVSEKLVLLPEANIPDTIQEKFGRDGIAPPKDDEIAYGKQALLPGKTYAESLPKAWRAEKIPRVTAYGTAQAYKMQPTAEFLRTKHGAKTKLYDDCLYVVYHLPLLPGNEGYRIRSSPVLKTPGGKSLLDEEIERNERTERHEGYFEDPDQFGVRYGQDGEEEGQQQQSDTPSTPESPERPSSPLRLNQAPLAIGEMFVFSYGVVVFWNFSERQEKDCLADVAFSKSETGISLVTRPQSEEDFETEEFHFEYNPNIPRPRIYNDMYAVSYVS